MALKTTPAKKVIAKANLKGFSLSKNKKISHKSHILYQDKSAFIDDNASETVSEALNVFGNGINYLLMNDRVKNIRITFDILEK